MIEEKFTPLTIMNERDKKELFEKLNEQFGIKKIPGIIVSRGKERIFLFTGDITSDKLKEIEKSIVIERVGIYLGKVDEKTEKIRLSIEGSQMLKDQITKNVYELKNNEDFEMWMQGQDLYIKTGTKEFLIIKYKDHLLGTGKASEEKISNYIPKNRRLKIKQT
ncbi:hypothetical protein HYT24_02940 [Candidatus Pacearchaeota archaeon]|nr:hypothetical protein [Candidatus Pacearchaeota archaeon]